MAKMLFRLPQAKRVIENPTPEEVKALAAKMPTARPTRYGNLNVQTQGARTLEGLDVPRHGRSRRPEPGRLDGGRGEVGRYPGQVHRRAGDGRGRRIHRERSRVPHGDAPLRRGREREHRRHAAAAVLRPARGRVRARAHRHLHAEPEGGRFPGRPADHGRPRARRHTRLQLRLLRGVQEGRPADVEQARLRPRRASFACRLQDHPDGHGRQGLPDRRAVGHRQDDHDVHEAERLVAGAGRLRRVDAGRPRVRDGERLLREDVRAQSRRRADDLRRGHPTGLLPRERVAER